MAQDTFTDNDDTLLATHDGNWASAGAPVGNLEIISNGVSLQVRGLHLLRDIPQVLMISHKLLLKRGLLVRVGPVCGCLMGIMDMEFAWLVSLQAIGLG